ncbi:F0F1 ATP synthase subunit delta [Caballeronia sp. DA-9]|uniref:F0F1 ATP synthase subunit delta n=1 Tax=Caballeronia sp. DA-9 TaxID=3436237 RepID=UPI003F66E18E
MHIDWWTLGFQTINVLVLVWLLAHFLFRPVSKIVAERQRVAAALLDDASAAKTAALDEQKKLVEKNAQFATERGRLMEAAAAEAAQVKATLEGAARAEAEQIRESGTAALEAGRAQAAAANSDRATQLALDITSRLLDRLPAEARITGFIDGLAAELEKLPESARSELTANDSPPRLLAPRPLTEEELSACHRAFSRALGRDLNVLVTVEPGVIAGLELDAAHTTVRNSFRHDLARLKLEFMAHDAHAT